MKRFAKRALVRLANMSWIAKIQAIFVLSCAVVMLLFTVLHYHNATELLTEEIIASKYSIMELLVREIKTTFDAATAVLYELGTRNDLRDVMRRDPRGMGSVAQMREYEWISTLAWFAANDPVIHHVRIYLSHPRIYTGSSYNVLSMETARKAPWYEAAVRAGGNIHFMVPEKRTSPITPDVIVLPAVRALFDPASRAEPIGFLEMDIDIVLLFSQIAQEAEWILGGTVYVVNPSGVIMCSKDPREVGRTIWQVPGMEKADLRNEGPIATASDILLNMPFLQMDWRLYVKIPAQVFSKSRKTIYDRMMSVVLVLLVLTLCVSAAFSKLMKHKIARVLSRVQSPGFIRDGAGNVRDELALIERSFTFLEEENQALANEIYREQLKRQEAQLAMYQAQINPHFLYNVLDIVGWLARQGRTESVVEVVRKLVKFYRTRLRKGNTRATIGEELDAVRAYVELQNIRLQDAVTLEIDVPPEMDDCVLGGMILQPLVENSIQHGILEKDSGTGTVRLSGRIENERVILCIEDDGVGMDARQVETLNGGGVASKEGGFGFASVNERIELMFGREYGAWVGKRSAGGTIVVVSIPLVR